jgi:hypothetical protein
MGDETELVQLACPNCEKAKVLLVEGAELINALYKMNVDLLGALTALEKAFAEHMADSTMSKYCGCDRCKSLPTREELRKRDAEDLCGGA